LQAKHLQPRRVLDKKKAFLIGDEDQALASREYMYKRPKEPRSYGLNKGIGKGKADNNCGYADYQAGAQFCKMLYKCLL
jgi:hypothetical protein